MRHAEVALSLGGPRGAGSLTYQVPDDMPIRAGDLVLVPLQARLHLFRVYLEAAEFVGYQSLTIVVLVSVSAPVSAHRVPEALTGLPIIRLFPHDQPASRDLISSRIALAAFSDGWRRLLNTVEADFPKARRVHVLAAVPTTAAVEMGRHRMREAQPALAVYQRTEVGYTYALDVR